MHTKGRRILVEQGDVPLVDIPAWDLHWQQSGTGQGLSLRLSALAGARNTATFMVGEGALRAQWGLNLVSALEGTWWLLRHLGVSPQLTAGGTTYFPLARPVHTLLGPLTPDVRLAFGLSF